MIAVLLLCLGVSSLPGAELALTREQPSASEQSSSPPGDSAKWELDLQAGGISGGTFSVGSPYFPEPGAEFLTFTGVPSRRVSSWYFGDGAALLARAVQPFGLVTPLDPVLHSSVISRKPGGSVGVRLGRRFTDRVRAEISVDYNLNRETTPLVFTVDFELKTDRDTYTAYIVSLDGRPKDSAISVKPDEPVNTTAVITQFMPGRVPEMWKDTIRYPSTADTNHQFRLVFTDVKTNRKAVVTNDEDYNVME